MEGHLLHPAIGPKGVRFFDHDEVEQLAGKRASNGNGGKHDDGAHCARVLELLAQGKTLTETMRATCAPLRLARRLYRLHLEDDGSLVLSARQLERLTRAIGRRPTSEDLVGIIERMRRRGEPFPELPDE